MSSAIRMPERNFPIVLPGFREFFSRVQLEPFCDWGWAYWGNARTGMMRIIGDVNSPTPLLQLQFSTNGHLSCDERVPTSVALIYLVRY